MVKKLFILTLLVAGSFLGSKGSGTCELNPNGKGECMTEFDSNGTILGSTCKNTYVTNPPGPCTLPPPVVE